MKKSLKRILCGALSLTLVSTLVVEHALRNSAAQNLANAAAFTDVTGEFDTNAIREQYFNDTVQKVETPKYETRSVIVSLTGDTMIDAAKKQGLTVSDYAQTASGQETSKVIKEKQDALLKTLKDKGIPYTLEKRYTNVLNGVCIQMNTEYVSKVKKLYSVDSVVITTSYSEPQTVQTQSAGGAGVENNTKVYGTGIYDTLDYTYIDGTDTIPTGKQDLGEGMVVAILDTGLDYTHPAFQNVINPSTAGWQKSGNVKAYVEDLLKDNNLVSESRSGSLDVNDVYISDKIPFAYDYADNDADVYPSYSNHGTHVAGIIGGYNASGYTDKDGNEISTAFRGVVPEAQLVICKTFTDDLDDPELGGAEAEDIVAALDDCVMLGVDVINMSLGSSGGFSTTNDGDPEGDMLNTVYDAIKTAGISLVCAASNDYSAGYGGEFGTNLITNPDSGTVGSPSTFAAALSVASISGQKAPYMSADKDGDGEADVAAFYEESRDENGKAYDFAERLGVTDTQSKSFKYVVVPGTGGAGDYTSATKKAIKNNPGCLVLVKRGDETFQEKVEVAMSLIKQGYDIAGIIVYNNVAGIIRMNLGEVEDPIPAVSIDMDSGLGLIEATDKKGINGVGTLTIDENQKAGPFMSDFSSWGPTHDLKIKPEITAHGGEITSTVPGGYGEQSGTSMASPNMAGVMAIIRSYIEKNHDKFGTLDSVQVNRLANQLIMSTATLVKDQGDRYYSPRKQGAGLGSLDNVVSTSAYLTVDNAESDYRPKLELGDDKDKDGVYEMTFKVVNAGENALTFTPNLICFTETIAKDGLAVAEQAYTLDPTCTWSVNGDITVGAKAEIEITARVVLSAKDKEYLAKFENGMYVEGFLQLVSKTNGQCDLSAPYLAFYGDWNKAPMLDYTAYEIAESEQKDLEENQKKARVFGTQPFTSYYNEKYVLPMGGYVYLVADDDDPVYAKEEYAAVSRYNVYNGEDATDNYLTSTQIKAVYAGLLRNARVVKYKMYDVNTGEVIISDGEIKRVSKAYSGGGQARPANVELELSPEEKGLMSGGQYRMEFEFFMDTPASGETAPKANTYAFTFTVDYEAPVLQGVRIEYTDQEDENGKKSQKIELVADVFDNHYAQAVMLCYPKRNAEGETVLQLATDYPMPVRNPNRNGTTSVRIDITDIYDEYGDQLYLQIDDYALNSCLYQVDLSKAQRSMLPAGGEFELAEGEEELTLSIYETHKVALVYEGEANLSNFGWTSVNPTIAGVKNGEIVGLKAGKTRIIVHDRNQNSRTINVTVTDEVASLTPVPAMSFNVIKTSTEALAKASGMVEVNAGETFTLAVTPDPWYHPMKGLEFVWESSNESVATVDQNGVVNTLKKGTAIISAKVKRNGKLTSYACSVTLRIPDEFDVSNFTLNKYHGVGWNKEYDIDGDGTKEKVLIIPDDMNIMYIGEDAFKDNDNVEYVVVPSSTVEIRESAFENCTALKGVFFSYIKHRGDTLDANDTDEDGNLITVIDWSDLSIIYEKAFYNCPNLEFVDFTNTKTITLASETFMDCVKLKDLIDLPSVGTMYHRTFKNCVSLENVNLSGLFVAGNNVFENCIKLASVETGKYTAVGNYMFKGCTNLTSFVMKGKRVGDYAFSGCENLASVEFVDDGIAHEYEIGAYAFENCGKTNGAFAMNFNGGKVRVIGDYAFKNSALSEIVLDMSALGVLGENPFKGSDLQAFIIDGDGTLNLQQLQMSGVPFEGIAVHLKTWTNDNTRADLGSYYEIGGIIRTGDTIVYVNSYLTQDFSDATITEIGAYAFAGSNIKSVEFPNVTKIGVGAFENAKTTSVTLGNVVEIPKRAFYKSLIVTHNLDNVQTIGAYAFAYSALNDTRFMNVQDVDDSAFEGCRALQRIEMFGAQNKTFGNGVFKDCISLIDVYVENLTEMGDYTFVGTSKLQYANIQGNHLMLGNYAFAGTPIQAINLDGVVAIGNGAFYGCENLSDIDLDDVRFIGAYAFTGCEGLTSVLLEDTEFVGAYAFANCSNLSVAVLPIAKDGEEKQITVGDYAFAGAEKLIFANLDGAVAIGDGAFMNTSLTAVRIDNAKTIGDGAFAGIQTLKNIQIGTTDENAYFFVENGVLYRYIDKDAGTLALVCYPAGLQGQTVVSEDKTEKRMYTLVEGTALVQAYAFYGLKDGMLDEVVMPYSVKTIGDMAFYASGVKAYTFESIQAPTLETSYRYEVEAYIESLADESTASYYKGFYHANFETFFVNFTQYGTEQSELVINYPENGRGYDNYIYSRYFGVRNTTGIHITDETRACRETIENMIDAETVKGWLNLPVNEANKQMVVDFAERVKATHAQYNNIVKDEAQLALLGQENAKKLMAIEEQLRQVKKRFDIAVTLTAAEVDATSTHRSEYAVGETFDMTGLVITLIYDDYSTMIADESMLTLMNTEALTMLDEFVEVVYNNTETEEEQTAYVMIKVLEELPSDSEQPAEKKNTTWVILLITGATVVVVGLVVLEEFVLKKRRKAKATAGETQTEAQAEDSTEVETQADEPTESQEENKTDE